MIGRQYLRQDGCRIDGDMAEAAQSLTYSLDIDRRQFELARRAGRSASDFGRER
jgi:hypothetical protein